MILEERKIEVEKSSNFQQTDFRIDAKYKNKVLWMLINQYRHKVRTPVQEIISNARDAQRENGNPEKPIKIQLPTKIDPTFKVRDYGVGMDEERIKLIFTSFGASTKNNDNSQTGGFGIGAKSPLAYTDSFNLKTFVNGRYWFYVIAKTENEGIAINLLSQGITDEENGTEVQIPVKQGDNKEFIESACRCTMFWDVLPDYNLSDEDLCKVSNGLKISDTLTIFNRSDLDGLLRESMYVLVDDIPYVIDYDTRENVSKLKDIIYTLKNGSIAVFKLNTGDIDLLQTRESIEETKKTLSKLEGIAFKGYSDINIYIKSFITENNLKGVFKQYKEVSSLFNRVESYNFANCIKFYNDHFVINKKLDTIVYNHESKLRSRSKVKSPQRHTDKILFDKTDIFYYDDLKNESDTLKNRRMRSHLETTQETVCLVKQGDASNFEYMRTLRLLKAKKLSSLELPKKQARNILQKGTQKALVKKLPTEVSMYLLKGGYYSTYKETFSRTFKIADINKIHVYIEYSKNNAKLNDVKYLKMLMDDYNVVPCKLSLKDISNIKDCNKFIHIDDYIKTLKPTSDIINYVISEAVKRQLTVKPENKLLNLISENSNNIVNKDLLKLTQSIIINVERYGALPKNIMEEIEKENQDKIKELVINCKKFNKLMEEKYPLINTDVNNEENIFYINSKEN